MNQLTARLEQDYGRLGRLQRDLDGIEDLLEERPVDPKNIIESMEQRE